MRGPTTGREQSATGCGGNKTAALADGNGAQVAQDRSEPPTRQDSLLLAVLERQLAWKCHPARPVQTEDARRPSESAERGYNALILSQVVSRLHPEAGMVEAGSRSPSQESELTAICLGRAVNRPTGRQGCHGHEEGRLRHQPDSQPPIEGTPAPTNRTSVLLLPVEPGGG